MGYVHKIWTRSSNTIGFFVIRHIQHIIFDDNLLLILNNVSIGTYCGTFLFLAAGVYISTTRAENSSWFITQNTCILCSHNL